jgi:pyruvate kinase
MLESMVRNLRPTRAEVTDIANAILDGTDYLMLSAETAAGEHPVEAVRMMNDIIKFTETSSLYKKIKVKDI